MLRHLALIPDGNRRWARKKGRPAPFGHRAGAKIISGLLQKARALGIPYVTIWGASVGNVTKRSPAEVAVLYRIFTQYFNKLAKEKALHEEEVRVRVLGRWQEFLPTETQRAIKKVVDMTKNYGKNNLTVLLAYSGVDEMTAAVTDIASESRKRKDLRVDPQTVTDHLWCRELPPVDLVIRTGGEPHWSAGFMMWHMAEAQMHFTPTLWPDFSPEELEKVVRRYGRTERRLGA